MYVTRETTGNICAIEPLWYNHIHIDKLSNGVVESLTPEKNRADARSRARLFTWMHIDAGLSFVLT